MAGEEGDPSAESVAVLGLNLNVVAGFCNVAACWTTMSPSPIVSRRRSPGWCGHVWCVRIERLRWRSCMMTLMLSHWATLVGSEASSTRASRETANKREHILDKKNALASQVS